MHMYQPQKRLTEKGLCSNRQPGKALMGVVSLLRHSQRKEDQWSSWAIGEFLAPISLSLDLAIKGKNEGAAQGRCGHLSPVLTSVNNEQKKGVGLLNLCMVKQCWPLFKEMGRLEIYHWSFCLIEFVFWRRLPLASLSLSNLLWTLIILCNW